MGTAENKALVQQMYADSVNRSGMTFADNLLDDATFIITGQNSWSNTFVGKDAILNGMIGHLRTLLTDRTRTFAYNLIAEGDFVVVEAKGYNVTKAGPRYDNEYCMVFKFENGKIKTVKEYCDSALVEKVLGPFPAGKLSLAKA